MDDPQRSAPALRLVPAPPADDDARWAAALAVGDAAVHAAIWAHFSRDVRRTLERVLGPVADVDDLLVEVFFRLFRRPVRLEHPSALRSFILTITTNVLRNDLRRRKLRRFVGLTSDGTLPDLAGFGTDPERRVTVGRLLAVLQKLAPEECIAFVLSRVEGRTHDEIATAMGLSESTVKRRLASATRRFAARVRRDPMLVAYLERGDGWMSGKGEGTT